MYHKCAICFGLIDVKPQVIVLNKKALCSECRFLYGYLKRQEKRDGKGKMGVVVDKNRCVD